MTRPLDKCVRKETKWVEREQNRLLSLSLSPSLYFSSSSCCVHHVASFVYRCNGGFIPAAVVCPQASPPASAARASGFLPLVLPPALA